MLLSKINQYLPSPVVFKKPLIIQNPSFTTLRLRSFSSFIDNPKAISFTESTTPSNSLVTNRFSISAQREAQDVLFYYLRFTRNFEFMDAEHISRNSPNFIHNLLSKIESEQGPTYSLSKFLRCRPINEFEPFFESLGLSPSEYSSLLPQNLLFLTDDHMLLNNFHVLCNYGIPRVKIGRMYKEATGIFRYEDGVMDLKLRAYEELGLSRSTVIKLVSCCPLLLVGSVSKEVIGVIDKLKILGIESDWIRGSLSGKMSYNWNRMIDIMDFLDKVGFTDEQQGILFRKNPAILTEGSTMNIHVLIARLLKSGLKLNDIFSLIMQNPQILAGKCAKNLWQAVRFLSKIGTEIGDMTKIIATHTRLLASHSWKAPRTIMKTFKKRSFTNYNKS